MKIRNMRQQYRNFIFIHSKMHKTTLIILALALTINFSYGQSSTDKIDTSLSSLDLVQATKAKDLVVEFATLLLKGQDIHTLLDKCSLPFVINGEKIISSKDELRKAFSGIINSNGKNGKIHIDSAYIFGSRKEILNDIIPVHVYFVVLVLKVKNGNDEFEKNAGFAVQISDELKIIGFG